jgi:hypothetical protein
MDHQHAVQTLAAERYLLEEMAEAERDEFEAHYFECAVCAESVRSGAVLADAARAGRISAGTASAAGAAAVPSPRRSFAAFAPLAAAATLALVAGYQTFVTVPGLRRQLEAPQALAPIAVPPVSRGEGIVVSRHQTDGPVVLALDINSGALSTQLVYDLRTDGGDVVLSGQAPVPPQGTPLLLLLPGKSLTSGQYAIVVRDSASPAQEVGTYRFIVR